MGIENRCCLIKPQCRVASCKPLSTCLQAVPKSPRSQHHQCTLNKPIHHQWRNYEFHQRRCHWASAHTAALETSSYQLRRQLVTWTRSCSIFDFNFLERCKNRQIMFITVQLKHSSAFLPPRDSFCCLFSASYCSNGSMLSRKSCVLPQFLSPKGFQGSTPATKKIKNSINTVFHVEKKVGYVQYHLLHHLFY